MIPFPLPTLPSLDRGRKGGIMTSGDDGATARYVALRGVLERLRHQFEHDGLRHNGLLAQRFWDAEQLTDDGWDAFARRASDSRSWEEWHVLAGGEGLIRLYGDRTALDDFARLAESGWLALAALEQAPAPGQVILGNDSHLSGWLAAVFETALATMTPTLRLEFERWGLEDAEVQSLNEFDPGYWCGSDVYRHPAYPCVQMLARDLFISSAEAIGCWLDPDSVVSVDWRLDDLPIRLPAVGSATGVAGTISEKPLLPTTDELTTRDAALFLKVSVDTLNAHVRAGRLPRRNVSPHGSSRGPFLYKVSDLTKLRDMDYRRTLPRTAPRGAKPRRAAPPPAEPDYDDLDL